MNEKALYERMGDKHEFLIKGGNYKAITNGKVVQWQLFSNKEKKFYTKNKDSETISWLDATVQREPILKTETKKNAITLLGYSCDEIVITTTSEVYKFYFNAKFAAKPEEFANHKFCYWSDYMQKAKAIPLKFVIESRGIIMTNVAVEIKAMPLKTSEFNLPAGSALAPNPN